MLAHLEKDNCELVWIVNKNAIIIFMPQREISLVFFSRHRGNFVQNPDSHNIKRDYDEGK